MQESMSSCNGYNNGPVQQKRTSHNEAILERILTNLKETRDLSVRFHELRKRLLGEREMPECNKPNVIDPGVGGITGNIISSLLSQSDAIFDLRKTLEELENL